MRGDVSLGSVCDDVGLESMYVVISDGTCVCGDVSLAFVYMVMSVWDLCVW